MRGIFKKTQRCRRGDSPAGGGLGRAIEFTGCWGDSEKSSLSEGPGRSTREEDRPEKGPFTALIVMEHLHAWGPGLGGKGLKC